MWKIGVFAVFSFSFNFEAWVLKETMSDIMKWIIWSYLEIFTLIGLGGLRGINSKNCVSTMESVIFYYGIVMGVDRGAD